MNANELTIENGLAVKTEGKTLHRLTRGFAKLRGKKKDEDAEDIPPVPFKDMLKLNLPDWYLVIPGVVAAALIGVMFPALAVLLSGALGVSGCLCIRTCTLSPEECCNVVLLCEVIVPLICDYWVTIM